jgi:ribosomal protein L29
MKDTLDTTKMRVAKPEEISARVLELKKSLMDKRFALKVGSVKDTSELGKIKRAVARLNGFITNRRVPAAAKPAAGKKK